MNYYHEVMFMKEHGFSIQEIDDMTPFDKETYTVLIEHKIRAREEAARRGK